MILRPLFCFKDTKDIGLLIFNSLKQNKLIVNFVVNRNWKKLTDSRKRAKSLADNRKSYHPIETLLKALNSNIECNNAFAVRVCRSTKGILQIPLPSGLTISRRAQCRL